MSSKLSQRPTYSPEQISQYLAILFHKSHPFHDLSNFKNALTTAPLATLSTLQRYHLNSIPWGDVALHYSTAKTVSLDSEDIFQKLVVRRHGGYCMETNALYSTILRSLGMKLYTTGSRISNIIDASRSQDVEGFNGWEHMIIIIFIDDRKYLIDVGFGNFGPLSPILLEDGAQESGVPGLETRLVYRKIADNVTDQKLWVLETCDSTSKEWKAGYCFGETEFLPQDFYTFNFRSMTDPASWFTTTFVLTRITLKEGPEGVEQDAQGTLTMFGNVLHQRLDGGKSEVLLECKSEAERVEALEKWFSVKLTEEEIGAIKETSAEIKPVESA